MFTITRREREHEISPTCSSTIHGCIMAYNQGVGGLKQIKILWGGGGDTWSYRTVGPRGTAGSISWTRGQLSPLVQGSVDYWLGRQLVKDHDAEGETIFLQYAIFHHFMHLSLCP